jgi:hypothetical protein
MKKILFTLILLSIIMNALAQDGLTTEVRAEIQNNMTTGDYFVKTISGSNVALDKKFSFGYQAGLAVGYYFNYNCGLSIGCLYSAQGQQYADYTEESNGFTKTTGKKTDLNYLKFPLQVHFTSASDNGIAFSAFAGYYYSLLLSYSVKTNINYSTGYGTDDASGKQLKHDITDNGTHYLETYGLSLSPYLADYGLTFGAGIEMRLRRGVYMPVLVNYQYGLADVKNRSAILDRGYDDVAYWKYPSDANFSQALNMSCLGLMTGVKWLF